MRDVIFAPGEFYHVFGRGVSKQNIFLDTRDYVRFLFLILHFQSSVKVDNISRNVNTFLKRVHFPLSSSKQENIVANREVGLVCFTCMPNHFHLLVEEKVEGGISSYMHKVLMAYAKYFNTRYEKSGHVFQGPFGAKHIENNEQLLHTSAYIHHNQTELMQWKGKEHMYPWSTYTDYVNENRWGVLLEQGIVMDQFDTMKHYQNFVTQSGVKAKIDFDRTPSVRSK